MAHLTCTDHKRRVMVLDTTQVLHRSDGSTCDSDMLTINKKLHTPTDVTEWPHLAPKTPEEQLLLSVFGKQ